MADKTRTGREYLRVSLDRSGRARSVEEQHIENERAAVDRGLALGDPYADNSISASRYTTKTRGDFARLLADLDKGRFGADELWLWEPSRGSRKVSEWVLLIEACEQAGVNIYVTTHGRAYDPANGRDRRSLLEDAVDSEYESSKVSARARRAAAANAAAGLPHGTTPYGYRRIYDPQTRKLVRQEPHPDEAGVVRELYDRLRRGHSLRAIAIDFEARGIRTRARGDKPGKAFSAPHLRDMVLAPVYMGLRVHAPRDKGGLRVRHGLDGAVKGTWEPLVSEETYYEVRRLLTRPERKTSRGGRAKHLLSLIAKCAECGSPLSVTTRRGPAEYQCHLKGCVRVDKVELDDVAVDAILGFLADSENFGPLSVAEQTDDTEVQQIRDQLAAARSELQDLLAGVESGVLSVATLTALEPGLRKRVTTLEERDRELSTPSELRGLIDPDKDVRQQWEDAPVPAQRTLARTVLSPGFLGELRVAHRPRDAGNRHVPAAQRVEWRRQ